MLILGLLFISLTNSALLSCSQAIPGCQRCSSDFNSCVECQSGFYSLNLRKLSVISATPSLDVNICVPHCSEFRSHKNAIMSRSCELDCALNCEGYSCDSSRNSCPQTPSPSNCEGNSYLQLDGQCSLFGCQKGFYRDSVTQSCLACDASCFECAGPTSNECLACFQSHYLSLNTGATNSGSCVSKTQQPQQPVFLIYVSNDENLLTNSSGLPLPHSQRDGSPEYPFLDLRDALTRAHQISAPYQHSNVTIYLTRGTHYLPLQDESFRYAPVGSTLDSSNPSFNLTLIPLPCDLNFISSNPAFVPSDVCLNTTDIISIRVKIGAYFYIPVSASLSVERIEFDFSDSLLKWGSTCQYSRSSSCSVSFQSTTDSYSVSPIKAGCDCLSPIREVSSCNYNHPVVLFDASPSPQEVNFQKKILLTKASFSNIFSSYNSLVGYESDSFVPLQVQVKRSNFSHISICGSIISSFSIIPSNLTYWPSATQTLFTHPAKPVISSSQSSLIDITMSNFSHFGLALQYDTQRGPELFQSIYHSSVFSRRATLLNLDSFPGEIVLKGNEISQHKLFHYFNHTFDPEAVRTLQGALISQQKGLIKQSIILITNSSRGVTLIGNSFEFISTLRGAVNIEMPSQYAKGAMIMDNKFTSCLSRYDAAALTLESTIDSAHPQSCSGFYLRSNIYGHNAIFSTEAAIVSLTCIIPEILQIDAIESLSFAEIHSYTSVNGSFSLQLPVPLSNLHSYEGLYEDTIIADFAKVSVQNETFSSNFVRAGEGNLMSAMFMPHLQVSDVSLYRNGDFSFLNTFINISEFWRDCSGVHLSTVQSSLLSLTSLNSLYPTSKRNDSQIFIYGTQTLNLTNIDIQDSQSSEVTSARPLLLEIEDVTTLILENVTISSVFIHYDSSLISFMLNMTNLLEEDFSQSWDTSHLFNRPMLESSASQFICYNCTFSYIATDAEFLALSNSPSRLQFVNSQVNSLHSVPFISSEQPLSFLSVSNSHFNGFTLAKAFPPSTLFHFSDSSINNAQFQAPSIPPSLCSLSAGYSTASISNSSFYSLQGTSKCVGQLLTSRVNVSLTISDSSFEQIIYEGWDNQTSPEYKFLAFTHFSSVNIDHTLFKRIQLGFNQPLIESYYSSISVNNSEFNTNLGLLFNVEYESLIINNTYVYNNFAHSQQFLIYAQATQNLYIHHSTFFYNYGGWSLFYLVATIGARFSEGVQVNPLLNADTYPDFYDVLFVHNMHSFLLSLRSGSSLFMSNITYDGNNNYQWRNLPVHLDFSNIFLYHSFFLPSFPDACYFADQYPVIILEGSGATLRDVSFTSFCSEQGLLYLTGCTLVELDTLYFTNIYSSDSGRLINFQEAALPLEIRNSEFINIQPKILVSTSGVIEISNCNFFNLENQLFSSRDSLTIQSSHFNSISAPSQVLIQCIECQLFSLSLSTFTSISAKHFLKLNNDIDDDAILPSSSYHYSLLNNTFQALNITGSGAFVFSGLLNKQVTISGNLFHSIQALQATQARGVLSIDNSHPESSVIISENQFNDCHAHVAGAIYYSDIEPVRSLNTFINVDATIYGDYIASYPMQMVRIESDVANWIRNEGYKGSVTNLGNKHEIRSMRSGEEIGEHYLVVLDKQNQPVRTVEGHYVQTSITRKNSTLTTNFAQILTLVNTKEWSTGVLHLNNISFIGNPGFHYELEISSSSVHIDLAKHDSQNFQANGNNPSVLFSLNLRTCERGQRFLNTGECQLCEEGSYLLAAVSVPTSCEKCPNYAQCFGGDQIGPAEGYWRPGSHSLSFIPCFNYHACLGAKEDDFQYEGSCKAHYKGILCSQCEQGYTRNSQFECSECPDFVVNVILLFILVTIVILFFYFVINCTLRSMTKRKSVFSVYFRLTINHLQMLMLISSFRFDWPPSVQAFFRLAHAVSDPPQELFSIDCIFQEMSDNTFARFYVYLFLYSLMPVFGILLALIICFIKAPRQVFCDKFIGSILVLIFLIHPAVSRFLFQAFNCYSIEGTDRLLEQMSEQCWTGNHVSFAFGIGLPGLAIWVVGLPLFIFLHLREKRLLLENPRVKRRLGFLYNGYYPRSYFWEILTLVKKDIIAFIAVFLIPQGTEIQSFVLLFVLLCLGFFTFRVMPWNRLSLNHLELHSLIALLVTVFSGLLFLSSSDPSTPYFQTGKDCKCFSCIVTLEEYSKWILFAFIFLANTSFFINIVWNAFGDTRSSIRNKCARFYVCCCLCGDRKLYKEEVQDEKVKVRNAQKVDQIHTVVECEFPLSLVLNQIKGKYERGEDFVHQKNFEELLPHLLQKLKKILLFKEKDLIGRRIFRQSSTQLMSRMTPSDCQIDFKFMDNSNAMLNLEFEQSPSPISKSKPQTPRKVMPYPEFIPLTKSDSAKSKDLSRSTSLRNTANRTKTSSELPEMDPEQIIHTPDLNLEYQDHTQMVESHEPLQTKKTPKNDNSTMSLRRKQQNKEAELSRRSSRATRVRTLEPQDLLNELEYNLRVESSNENRFEIIMEEEERKEGTERVGGKERRGSDKKSYKTLRKDRRSIHQNEYFQSPKHHKEESDLELNFSQSMFSQKFKEQKQKERREKKKSLFSEKQVSLKSKDPISLGLNRI